MGKHGHGKMGVILNMLKQAEADGLIKFSDTRFGYMMKSNHCSSQELVHKGERAYHYANKFINKLKR
jgi:hypothetical protein